jgi:hypothetical protein
VFLAVALVAFYGFKAQGRWRAIYIACATLALWFNIFVAIVQAFAKIAPLQALAPTQTEPPFALVQGATLLVFVVFGVLAVRRHPA